MSTLHHITPEGWDVRYPDSLMKYIDHFRVKYFKYDIYDRVLSDYIKEHKRSNGVTLCSLGCGTAHHEIELAKHGFRVTGIDRHSESLELGKRHVAASGQDVTLIECNMTDEKAVKKAFEGKEEHFDVIVMLLIPLSVDDHDQAFKIFAPYLKQGGLFITSLFGYDSDLPNIARTDHGFEKSDIEVAEWGKEKDFVVRLNAYRYANTIIHWDAVYVYQEEGRLCMKRDHDILEVTEEGSGSDPFSLGEAYTLLPSRHIHECGPGLTPPYVYEYLIGWRKGGD